MPRAKVVRVGPPPSTLHEIATAAAVSLSTVSKVLNARPGVAPATRERVEQTLRDRGYKKRGTTQTYMREIDLMFGALDGAWAIEVIRGVVGVARENLMTVNLIEGHHRYSFEPVWIEGALKREPAGVIFIASDLPPKYKDQLRTRNIPFVFLDPAGNPAPDIPAIGSANWAGGTLATRHLIELGHRRIGMIAGAEEMMSVQARVAGFRFAMESAGLPIDEDLIVHGPSRESADEAGSELGTRLLSMPVGKRPTAIFALSDIKALGAYEAARALGLSVPDDVSIVGYDDLQFARWAGPPLTTVRQPLKEMGEEAARLVIRLRQDNTPERPVRLELSTSLVLRSSTARLA